MQSQQPQTFNRTLIVAILLAGAFVTILNQTLLVVAIFPVMEDLNILESQAQWLTTAFMLMNGILIPITAFFIDRFSTRSLLITAMGIFSIGTLVGAFAPNFPILLVARIIQAGGAGIMMPLMQTIILTIYPPEKRGAAMGTVGLVIGFAPAIGPTLSGFILDQFTWRYLFYIVLPIAVLVMLLFIFFMKNVTTRRETKIDIVSIISSSFGWGGLLYGFSIAGVLGWTSITVILTLFIGASSLLFFIYRQFKLKQPMLEFRVFQSNIFTLTTILSVFVFALMIGTQMLLPIYIQKVRGLSALGAGLSLLPGAIIMGGMSPITGRIFDRAGGRGLAITGFVMVFTASILFTNLQIDTYVPLIAVNFALMMLGTSMIMMPMTTAGINDLPPRLIAHGTAMNNTIRMVGGSIGTAILVSVMSSVSIGGEMAPDEVMSGMHLSFIVTSAIAFVGLLLSFKLKKKPKPKPASATT